MYRQDGSLYAYIYFYSGEGRALKTKGNVTEFGLIYITTFLIDELIVKLTLVVFLNIDL